MSKEFKLQDPGEGIHEAEIIEIQVSEGDRVQDGDVVFVVDTDKAAVEIPAPFDGTVEEILVEEDEVVEVGDVLLTYSEEGEAESEAEEEEREKEADEEGEVEDSEEAEEAEESEEKEESEEAGESEEARESGEAEPDERAEAAEEEKESAEARESEGPEKSEDRPVPASPATRRLARELEVDLREVPGSGPQGRVTSHDVRSFAEEGAEGVPEEEEEPSAAEEAPEEAEAAEREQEEAPEETKAPEEEEEQAPSLPFHTLVKEPPPLPDFSHWGPVRTEPLRRIRRNVARRMTMAWMEVPHVNHHQEVDITELERFRKEHEGAVEEEGGKLTLTILVMKAAVAALKAHPRFNASLDVESQEIVLKDYYNLGLAVDTPEGLVVPVIRGVDGKSLVELSVEVAEVAERVRNGEANQEDVQGGTFTLTNPGPIGGDAFTPILRYPEAAILGMAAARLKPVVEGDLDDWEMVPRLMLPLVLAFDHRINDGADAARFMSTLVETLGDMDAFLLKA